MLGDSHLHSHHQKNLKSNLIQLQLIFTRISNHLSTIYFASSHFVDNKEWTKAHVQHKFVIFTTVRQIYELCEELEKLVLVITLTRIYWNPSIVSVSLAGHQAVQAAEWRHCITKSFLPIATTCAMKQSGCSRHFWSHSFTCMWNMKEIWAL
jgi:hypothetical protein